MKDIPGEELIDKTLTKTSPWAISIGVGCILVAGAAALFAYAVSPTYLEAKRIASDAAHFQSLHAECERRLSKLEAEVKELKQQHVAKIENPNNQTPQ